MSVGVWVGEAVAVRVAVAVKVGVDVGVAEGVLVEVAVAVHVGVEVGRAVAVLVGSGVRRQWLGPAYGCSVDVPHPAPFVQPHYTVPVNPRFRLVPSRGTYRKLDLSGDVVAVDVVTGSRAFILPGDQVA